MNRLLAIDDTSDLWHRSLLNKAVGGSQNRLIDCQKRVMCFTRTAVAWVNKAHHHRRALPSKRQRLEFELLFLLETEPQLTQREIASRLDVSLGRVNLFLKSLRDRGSIRFVSRSQVRSRLEQAYEVTQDGVSARRALTGQFLEHKIAEFERLARQIEALRQP